ncbi:hypothetical protein JZ751_012673 [Albula glossodonta]|uniref:FHF complex subunit HOOK-interacting protein 1B n=1 Tax=Albula glossodonta TaxID=121402 RepID=A0A8T2N043_9TELE|nr:hypothetical protein JZ751_012673 [Albula glossodonta]
MQHSHSSSGVDASCVRPTAVPESVTASLALVYAVTGPQKNVSSPLEEPGTERTVEADHQDDQFLELLCVVSIAEQFLAVPIAVPNRMSWLSRLTPSRSSVSRANQNHTPPTPVPADPETCLMVFQNHWRQMMCLLVGEQGVGGAPGPILQCVLAENVLERLLQWHLGRGLDLHSQGALLRLFELLLGQAQQPLLQHGAVLQPLLRLLGSCVSPLGACPTTLEPSLVLLLNQVCVSLAQQPTMLEIMLQDPPPHASQSPAPNHSHGPTSTSQSPNHSHGPTSTSQSLNHSHGPASTSQSSNHSHGPTSTSQSPNHSHGLFLDTEGPTPLLVFSLLVPFIHREGVLGQQARDALLLVMAATSKNQAVASYIANNSYFCPVLATGLSALYSSLPRKIEARGDDWHALRPEDWVGVSSLVLFMNSLEFCNAVVQVAHPLLQSQLLQYLHTGFLVPVMGPALHKLCMVSLSLFHTLLSLHCEDVMLQLVFRYLLPCTHVMISQRRAVRDTDMYGKSAEKFLSLIPECCRMEAASSTDQGDESASWEKSKPSAASHRGLLMQHESGDGGAPADHTLPAAPEGLDGDWGFLGYLRDARRGIELCSWGCRDWSAPYDGQDPSPNFATLPPPPPTAAPSLRMVPEHFSLHPVTASSPISSHASLNSSDSAQCNTNPAHNDTDSAQCSTNPAHNDTDSAQCSTNPAHNDTDSAQCSTNPAHNDTDSAQNRSNPTPKEDAIGSSYKSNDKPLMQQQEGGMEVNRVRRDGRESCLLQGGLAQGSHSQLTLSTPAALLTETPELGVKCFQSPDLTQSLGPTPVSPSSALLSGPTPTTDPSPNSTLQPIFNKYPSHSGTPPLGSTPTPDSSPNPTAAVWGRGLEWADRLMEELLERGGPVARWGVEAGGQGINIEAFEQELSQLEEWVQEKRSVLCPLEEPRCDLPTPDPCRQAEELAQKTESSAKEAGGSVWPLSSPPTQPYTGPFMTALLAKLQCMLQNSLYVNIQLTGILTQLACYPQPLLRSFLLNTNMVFQPSVKSLLQVLGSVRNQIEAFAAVQLDFPAMLRKARRYLFARGKLDWADPPGMGVPNLRRSYSLSGNEALRVKNVVYSAVVFSEFLMELAALVQEHSVALPFPHSQGAAE